MRIMDIIFYFGVTTDLLILVKRDLKTLGGDFIPFSGADLGGGCRGCAPPPPEMTCGFLIQLVFCKKKKTMWFIGVEVEQETSAPPPEKNPGSAPAS